MKLFEIIKESAMAELDDIVTSAYDEVAAEGGGTSSVVMKKAEKMINAQQPDKKKARAMIAIARREILGEAQTVQGNVSVPVETMKKIAAALEDGILEIEHPSGEPKNDATVRRRHANMRYALGLIDKIRIRYSRGG